MNATLWCAGPLPPSWAALGNSSVLDMHTNHLTGALSKPTGPSSPLASLTALSPSCKHHGRGCRLTVCRAAASLMVCTRTTVPPCSRFQLPDRCALRACKSLLSMNFLSGLSSVGTHPGRECRLTVCRAAATFMVCTGNIDLPVLAYQ